MATINIEKFKENGFSFEEIESIKKGVSQIEKGEVYDENTFYSNLEKRLFQKSKNHA